LLNVFVQLANKRGLKKNKNEKYGGIKGWTKQPTSFPTVGVHESGSSTCRLRAGSVSKLSAVTGSGKRHKHDSYKGNKTWHDTTRDSYSIQLTFSQEFKSVLWSVIGETERNK
jgi:hypothetical protein